MGRLWSKSVFTNCLVKLVACRSFNNNVKTSCYAALWCSQLQAFFVSFLNNLRIYIAKSVLKFIQ